MATINKGLALVSVADVMFFDPVSDAYMGEGLALTDSTLTQEVQNIEQRGGYLNALLFDIKHSKSLTVALTSATFKMEYLAFQTGTNIITDSLDGIYEFSDCITFTNGVATTSKTPVGNVFVRMENGVVKTVTPAGNTVDIGDSTFNGTLTVAYQYNTTTSRVVIDTKSQPLTVKAVMKIHVLDQDGVEGYIQITIPRLKFDGSITLSLTADGVSTFNLSGTAQEYSSGCDEGYYAYADYITETETATAAVEAIAATPSVVTLSLAGTKTATANVIGVRSAPYTNVALKNSDLTFNSAAEGTATVDNNGVITGVAAGTTQITVTYEGLQDIISVTVEE